MKQLPPSQQPPAQPNEPLGAAEGELDIGEVTLKVAKGILKRFYYLPLALLVCIGGAYAAYKMVEPSYSSSATISIRQESIRNPELQLQQSNSPGYLQAERRWFTYRPIIEKVIDQVDLGENIASEAERRRLIQELQKRRIRVATDRGASVIQIWCSWKDPYTAKEIVETLADTFIETYKGYNESELRRQTEVLERQLSDIQQKIEEEQASLTQFQEKIGVMHMDDGVRNLHETMTSLERRIANREFDLETIRQKIETNREQLDSLLASSPINTELLQNLTTPYSPLYNMLEDASQLESVVQLLDKEKKTLEQMQEQSKENQMGGISPVNEDLRLSLVRENSPLRMKLLQVQGAEEQIRALRRTYMDKHERVQEAKARLEDASAEAIRMIAQLDPNGIDLYRDMGASELLFRASLWEPGIPSEHTGQDPRRALAELRGKIKEEIRRLDPAGVPLYENNGAEYLINQARLWRDFGNNTPGRRENLERAIKDLKFQEETLERQLAGLNEDLMRAKARMASMPADQAILEEKLREIAVWRETEQMLRRRLTNIEIDVRSNMWQIEVLDPPIVDDQKDSPQPKKFFASAIALALAIGLGFPVLLELMDDRIRSPQDIEKKLGLSVLATLPQLSQDSLTNR